MLWYIDGITENNAEYDTFVDKFKPRKTTDDCFTPPIVYDAVADYVAQHYGLDRASFVRPFRPGGDFEQFAYAPDAVVVDNPPFSILSRIMRWYIDRGVRFFLFAPSLTIFSGAIRDGEATAICTYSDITYDNGAVVRTSFVTNLEPGVLARAEPQLYRAVKAANEANLRATTKSLPKYCYPREVLTASMLNYMAEHDVHYEVRTGEAVFIHELDAQKAKGKTVYGGGLLLSEKAAAEKAAAEKAAAEKAGAIEWQLSDRERAVVAALAKNEGG